MKKQYIVFTDMDGTLLDHNSYSFEPAVKTLAHLHDLNIPVIPNTSKTFDELIDLRQNIGLTGPFIVENGAAIHIPHGFFAKKPSDTQWLNNHWVKQFTSRKSHWLSLLNSVKADFEGQFTHFSQMSIAQIMANTGLSEPEAQRAANRQYGEPVLWLGNEQQKHDFIESLRNIGARPLIGGRFIHISGESNKGSALEWLVREFERQYPSHSFISIALGDGQNDADMLDAATISVRIKSPTNPLPQLHKTKNVITTSLEGPEGWSQAIQHILNTPL
ncbi:HAD-IIB family hydrolase [Aliiglaciecola sp. LCG003]|uniref:HAD-IIB family hydrolase n=1 Tax=Aliiglaciecola sp. LCG003 TaxID=3053655 RepID=UPI0025736705|nr:HAD-IIB family hydrolase [Aliiglaciecola sp. LCG003]WJG11123.1 HAD-IIB family hydrolase [Aliiglaciecola sp. LCG003]